MDASPKPVLKILIVDDDAMGAEALSRRIALRLASVQTRRDLFEIGFLFAGTLHDGIAMAPDSAATVLDLGLPDATQEEVFDSFGNFKSPVIVWTGDNDPKLTALCIAKGADAVYLKGHTDGICRTLVNAMILRILNASLEEQGSFSTPEEAHVPHETAK